MFRPEDQQGGQGFMGSHRTAPSVPRGVCVRATPTEGPTEKGVLELGRRNDRGRPRLVDREEVWEVAKKWQRKKAQKKRLRGVEKQMSFASRTALHRARESALRIQKNTKGKEFPLPGPRKRDSFCGSTDWKEKKAIHFTTKGDFDRPMATNSRERGVVLFTAASYETSKLLTKGEREKEILSMRENRGKHAAFFEGKRGEGRT